MICFGAALYTSPIIVLYLIRTISRQRFLHYRSPEQHVIQDSEVHDT